MRLSRWPVKRFLLANCGSAKRRLARRARARSDHAHREARRARSYPATRRRYPGARPRERFRRHRPELRPAGQGPDPRPTLRSTVSSITAENPDRRRHSAQGGRSALQAPLRRRARAHDERREDLVKRLAWSEEAIGAYKNDHTRLAWLDWTMTGDKPADFKGTYEEVLQHAVSRGSQGRAGLPRRSAARPQAKWLAR